MISGPDQSARRRTAGALLFALGLLSAACSAGKASPESAPSAAVRPADSQSSTTATAAGATAPDSPTLLPCPHVIGSTADVGTGHTEVLARVALPTAVALEAWPGSSSDPNADLFAKDGLLIRPGASFDLVVPDEWRGRLTIGWGSPAKRTTHLRVAACASTGSSAPWLAYAGGYWVRDPACVSLDVIAGAEVQRVEIGVGAPCAGQDRPRGPGS